MTDDADDEVVTANSTHYTAVESGDLDLLSALWVDGSAATGASCVHPGWAPIRGRSAVLRSYAAIMAGTSYMQFFLTDVEVSRAGDAAVVTCTENLLTAGEGTTFEGGRAVATNVFVRQGGQWRLWSHHASPVLTASDDDD